MPKNVPIPNVPTDIRRHWLKLAARPQGCRYKEWLVHFGEEAKKHGLVHCVYRTWQRQLVRKERVARLVGRGCQVRMRAAESRL